MSSSPQKTPWERHSDPAIRHLAKETLAIAKKSGASQEVIDSLEKGLDLALLRLQFEEDITSKASTTCDKLYEKTRTNDWQKVYDEGKTTWNSSWGMISGQVESQFLKSFLSAAKAKDVLEVGMFTGYSALAMAETLPADGKVVTIDQDEYFKTFHKSITEDSPHKDKVHIEIGRALEIMKRLADEGQSFDAVFLDAVKSEYGDYLKMCFEGNLLRPNGTVIVDNAFCGKDGYTNPESSAATFGQSIKNNPDLHVVLVPMRDGIFLIRRQKDVDGETN